MVKYERQKEEEEKAKKAAEEVEWKAAAEAACYDNQHLSTFLTLHQCQYYT
jgi:hypothetical protein